jgi:hypothetical protein
VGALEGALNMAAEMHATACSIDSVINASSI